MRTSRSGFTLVELLVSLILFVIVGGSMYSLLNVSQRVSRTQTEKAAMQGGLRTGVQLAIAELQEVWTDDVNGVSAITVMAQTDVHYNAMRGLGVTCAAPTTTQLMIRTSSYSGLVNPPTTDGYGAYLFVDKETNREDDDDWQNMGNITAVGVGVCDDGNPGIQLTFADVGAFIGLVQPIAPVRIYELMELGEVANAGRNWLGLAREGSSDPLLKPIAGPLQTNGVEFKYYDATNTEIFANPEDVKTIVMRLFGETDRAGNKGGLSGVTQLLQDTVTVRVQLRNAR
jgi:prepilin-type N-terminal cleavage/methylation domain-containing protein